MKSWAGSHCRGVLLNTGVVSQLKKVFLNVKGVFLNAKGVFLNAGDVSQCQKVFQRRRVFLNSGRVSECIFI